MRRRDVSWTIALCAALATHAFLMRGMIDAYIHELDRRALVATRLSYPKTQPGQVQWFTLPPDPHDDFGEHDGAGKGMNSAPGDDPLQAPEGDQDQAYLSRDPVGLGRLPDEPSPSTVLPGVNGDNRPPAPASAGGGRPQPPSRRPSILDALEDPPTPLGPPVAVAIAPQPRLTRQPPLPPPPPPPPLPMPPVPPMIEPIAIVQPAVLQPTTQSSILAISVVVPTAQPPLAAPPEPQPKVAPPPQPLPPSPPTPPAPRPMPAAAPQSPPPAAAPAPNTPPANPGPTGQSGQPTEGGHGPAGPPVQPADSGPQSDQESDPFAEIGSVEFRAGSVKARLGQKVKTIKPRLGIKGELDLVSLNNPSIILKVAVDEAGNVTDVGIVKSSGSNEVDHPTCQAVYKWWFEPHINRQGKPIPYLKVFTISWR